MDLAVKYPDEYINCCEDLDLPMMSPKSFELFRFYLSKVKNDETLFSVLENFDFNGQENL